MSARELLLRQDRSFLDFARSLTPRQWAMPSLCSQWTTHEVLAHLVIGSSMSVPSLCRELAVHRMNFDRTNAVVAQRLAYEYAPEALMDSFELLAERRHGIGKLFPPTLLMGDHVMHHLDIALALGEQVDVADEIIHAVLDAEVGIANPFVPAKRNASDLVLRASDTGWAFTAGRGALGVVVGEAAHIASALAGRPHALAFLEGDGVVVLRTRIEPPIAGRNVV
ncbi:hypothetical protein B1R94_10265 [Mycolicibacterium litorale]|nr:hypothetical protein B1R94_10265 [Mycolicibacterium litorale]